MNNYHDQILIAVKYIEAHIYEDVTLAQVADAAGFSRYHFSRIFRSVTGRTFNDYMRRRRLTLASKLLLDTDDRIIDIAFRCKYASQEAFTRAFVLLYDRSPLVYRQEGVERNFMNKVMLTEEILIEKGGALEMVPEIQKRDSIMMVGFKYTGKNENNEIATIWYDLNERIGEIENRVSDEMYGYDTWDATINEDGIFTYVAGVPVKDLSSIPEGMVGVSIPENRYAVFTLTSVVENIHGAVKEVFSKWLPESGHRLCDNYDFEYYGEGFKANDPEHNVYFYVPIK